MPTTVETPITGESQAERELRRSDLAHARMTGLADALDRTFGTIATALQETERGEITPDDLKHLSEVVRGVLTELYGNGSDASRLELVLQLEEPGLQFANALRRLADAYDVRTRRNRPALNR